MRSLELAMEGAWKVLVAGVVFGAGMPVIYALGMRALTLGSVVTVDEAGHRKVTTTWVGRALAALLVLVVLGGIALGITLIVASGFGKKVSFEHVIPMIVDKKK